MQVAWRLLKGALPILVLCLLVSVAPSAAAAAYEGPGQKGVVPVGEGGALVPILGGFVDDRVFAVLSGLPADTCRLVLDANGTYGDARLTWSRGDSAAYVWAEAGQRDVSYRLHAVWHDDLNGNCTAEETAEGTIWHDPRGRPFVDLALMEERLILEVRAGGEPVDARLDVHNNGTIPDNVTAGIKVVHPDFKVTSIGKVRQVAVGPLETVPFVFRVSVPEDGEVRVHPVQVGFTSESGWSQAFTFHLSVLPSNATGDGDLLQDPAESAPLPPPSVTPEEAPLPVVVVLFACTLALLARRRM